MSWTLSQIKDKVRRDLGLNAERYITTEELRTYINTAIEDAAQIINDQGSDYFMTLKDDYNVTAGDSELDLPDDIYDARMRFLYFDENPNSNTNDEVYQVDKIAFEEIPIIQSTEYYKYRLMNDATNGFKVKIYPDIRETGTGYFKLWYIRKAKELTDDDDVCDIPRINYIFSHVKLQCMKKEPNHPLLQLELETFKDETERLMKSFDNLTDDGQDVKLEPDYETLNNLQDFGI